MANCVRCGKPTDWDDDIPPPVLCRRHWDYDAEKQYSKPKITLSAMKIQGQVRKV